MTTTMDAAPTGARALDREHRAITVGLLALVTTRRAPILWGRRPAYAVVAATGAVALHVAGHRSGVTGVLMVTAGLLVVVPAARALLPRGTLRADCGLPAVVAARGIFGAAFACVELFLPLVLQGESGLSPTVVGLLMMVGALGWSAGSSYAGTHGDAAGFPSILRTAAAALLVGALVSLGLVPLDHRPLLAAAVATLGFAVMAVGMGLATPLMSTLALDLAAGGRQGESGAAIQMSDALGQSIAAGVVGAVFARWFLVDQGTSYLAGFGLAALLGALAVVVSRRCLGGPDAGGGA